MNSPLTSVELNSYFQIEVPRKIHMRLLENSAGINPFEFSGLMSNLEGQIALASKDALVHLHPLYCGPDVKPGRRRWKCGLVFG